MSAEITGNKDIRGVRACVCVLPVWFIFSRNSVQWRLLQKKREKIDRCATPWQTGSGWSLDRVRVGVACVDKQDEIYGGSGPHRSQHELLDVGKPKQLEESATKWHSNVGRVSESRFLQISWHQVSFFTLVSSHWCPYARVCSLVVFVFFQIFLFCLIIFSLWVYFLASPFFIVFFHFSFS